MTKLGRSLAGICAVMLCVAAVLVAGAVSDPGWMLLLILVPFILALVGIPVFLLAKGVDKGLNRLQNRRTPDR